MRVFETAADFREARRGHGDLGFVPTMGFLHEGHMSLVARARAEAPAVAASLFVNPTQFGDPRDLELYPRDLPGDLAKLEGAGVDLVFAPTAAGMYPPAAATRVEVGPIADVLEGASRPGHFAGVATVVAKLFNIVAPTRAYFGAKDAQQVAVIRRMVRDLDLPVQVTACPTVREPDGLAMSSRNVRLSPAERAAEPLVLDVTDADGAARAVADLAGRRGRLDILVNNVGLRDRRPLFDFALEDVRALLEADLVAPFHLSREAARPMMAQGRGRILNLTSLAGPLARPGDAAYTAAKGGLAALTRALAAELGPHGITANAVAPGYFATETNEAMAADPEVAEHLRRRTALGRWGRPEEIAGAAVFLASDAASYVTGQVLAVDGGYSAHF